MDGRLRSVWLVALLPLAALVAAAAESRTHPQRHVVAQPLVETAYWLLDPGHSMPLLANLPKDPNPKYFAVSISGNVFVFGRAALPLRNVGHMEEPTTGAIIFDAKAKPRALPPVAALDP